jgi:signal transduction histidine kinase
MLAFDWDLLTDQVTRIGDLSALFGIDIDVGSEAKEYFALVHPDDRDAMRAAIGAIDPAAPEISYEYRVRLPNGRIRWVRDTARGEFDTDGKLVRLRGLAADITERRDAEARLLLLANISEMIGAIDDPAALLYDVSCALGAYLDVRRCLFTEIDLEHDRGIVRRDYCREVTSVAGVYRVSDYPQITRADLEQGRIVLNRDSKNDPRTAANYERTYEPYGERAYIAVPLLRDGRWVAELWVSDDMPRDWSTSDVALLQTVAERVWTAVEKLRVVTALRESEARIHFVGERAAVGYWYWEIAADRLIWSHVCKRLFGIADDAEMTYAGFLAAVHPADRDRVEAAVRTVLDSNGLREYDVEIRTVWPDGTIRWIQSKGSATFEGNLPVRMAGIALDITRRKLLELEREEMLARERRLRAEADEASLAKDHFLALLSHELRTPMTTILGWASFLRTGHFDTATTEKGLQSIEQASRTQARLIDDLLDVSRIVAGKLALEQKLFDAMDSVRSALEVIQPAARASAIDIVIETPSAPALILGDRTRVQQVIWNLLSNAIKFTPLGGRVYVSVQERDDFVEICVRDSGIGIEAEFLPHVFERFRQAEDGPSRSFGGLGLGLSIVRHITELHGGTVHAASAGLGRGAEFTVRFPRIVITSEPALPRENDLALSDDALAEVHVLVVDDDAGAREVLATMLRRYGARVTTAAGVRDAMQHVATLPLDVVVSDIGMPGEDGYDLIRRLRTTDAVATRIPAIAVTAYADPRDRDRALAAGYQAHLAKPVEPLTFAAAVLRVLRPM